MVFMDDAPKTPLEALEKAVEIKESQHALAKAIGKDHQSYVGELLRRLRSKPTTKIPADICPLIEQATDGQVTRQMLRPDFPWAA